MATESIISATFGVPGAGKTYSRVRFLVEDFLINNPDGLYITNIPLAIPEICNYIAPLLTKKRGEEVTPDDIRKRLVIIPDDELVKWEKLNQLENKDLTSFDSSTFLPTVWLQQYNLQGAHIAIDEFHKYFSRKGPRILRKLWNDWFAEIRKTGCIFEAITQSYGQMSDEFLDKCATRLELVNHSELRDPFFKIRMGDWYELRAGLFKKLPLQRITEKETMRGTSNSGNVTWRPTGRTKSYTLDPFFFQFYNSFRNYSGSSAQRQSPSEIYGRKIIFWFLRRNFIEIFMRFLIVGFIAWFLLGGGMQWALMSVFRVLGYVGDKNPPAALVSNVDSVQSDQAPEHVDAADSVVKSSQSQNLHVINKKSNFEVKNDKTSSGSVSDHDSSDSTQVVKPADLNNFRPALFWDDFVFLRNGLQVHKGYKFQFGVLNGKTITIVDKKKRLIGFDDGTFLFMHVVGE